MVSYIEGNIFDTPAQVIVNPVNTVGVMGKGLALAFRKRYPKMFDAYRSTCERRQLSTGKLMLYREPDHWILLFPTKEHWRNPSRIEYIQAGLEKFVDTYAAKGITSAAFPRLGCGNGELDWQQVRPVMESFLNPLPIDIWIYSLSADKGGTAQDIPEHRIDENLMCHLEQPVGEYELID